MQSGFAFKTEYFTSDDGLPLIRIRDLPKASTEINYCGEYREEFLVEKGDYLIGMDGNFRCFRWQGPRGLLNQRVCRLRNFKQAIDPEYVYYGIQKKLLKIEDTTSFVTVKHISAKQVQNIELPLPSLDEQHRIVDILSRADGIVRLRREAQQKAAELIPAIFLDMFGDPATNPRGWAMRKISDFVSRLEGGKNIQAGSENGSPYRILKVSAVTSGVYRESESKPAPDGYKPPAGHIVRAGDMLFSRANTVELVGATAIVKKTDGKTLLPDKLWRFVWAEPVEPAYMRALFQSSHVRRELGRLSSGTSASMRNISQAKLFGLPLPVAPYDKQKEFGERAAAVHSIQSQQAAATAKAESTFAALLAQVFAATA
ncbi:MAG: restriction endonuclease subunit S [Burkholderiales bacterium]